MRNLNYKHLRYFWMVAKTGSIARAAEQLHLTPQSISGQLTEFAQVLGVDLFRRSGRNLEVTAEGRKVLSYAEEIFAIGDDLLNTINNEQMRNSLPLIVGIADSVSKSVAYRLLEPALQVNDAVRLTCREGRLIALLSDLSVHKLDMIIADRPIPPHLNVLGYNHLIGESSLTVFGAKELAQKFRGNFPSCINQAPFLLPGEDSAISQKLLRWIESNDLKLNVKGEFDDSALLKSFGQAGVGLFAAPTAISENICHQYQVEALGEISSVKEQIYIITTERKLTHPAIIAINNIGRDDVFKKEV